MTWTTERESALPIWYDRSDEPEPFESEALIG